jgi:cholest-4-en-3-one 26-monooxygenase
MNLDDINLTDPDHFNDGAPHEWFQRLRAHDPVHWQPETDGAGFWAVTKYEDVKAVSREPRVFSSWEGCTNIFELDGQDLDGSRLLMLNMDPPQHAKFRRLVSKGFTPKRIATMREHVRELARSIVDRIAERGECEFVSDVASQVPMQTICEMLGVPESDRQRVYDISNKLIGFDDPEFQTSFEEGHLAAAELFMYASELGTEKKKCPMDDLASTLIEAEVDGEKLTDMEFQSFFLLLAIAGNETTRTVTSQGMRLLSANPDAQRRIVEDMSQLPHGVEEILRYNPAVMHFRRTATEDINLRGKQIRKGDKVVVWYPSANRDEEIYTDPHTFNVDRWPNDHLAFGVGEHFCLGASLARLQLCTIFEELLTRLPDIQVEGPVRYLRSNFIDGIKEMHVRFTPESQRRRAAS